MTSKKTNFPSGFSITDSKWKIELKMNNIKMKIAAFMIFKISKNLSKRVILRHDYMPFEFCVYIYKNDSISGSNVFKEFEHNFNDKEKKNK